VALEYEGDFHRTDATTWRRDITSRELFESVGWRVIRVTAEDLYTNPAAFVSRVRRILAAR
jgi:very-short-patch-repair endonuclease